MRRWAIALAGLMVVAACTGDDDADSSTTASTPAPTSAAPTTSPPATQAPTSTDGSSDSTEVPAGTTIASSDDEELPILADVDTPEWVPETRTDELALEIGEGERLTPQQAVDAFAVLYPDMPGATPSDLPPGDGLGGTYTWRLINSVRDRLAPQQRDFVDEQGESDPIGAIGIDGTVTFTESSDGAAGTTQPSGLRRVQHSSLLRVQVTPVQHYVRLAGQVWTEWYRHRPDLPRIAIQVELSRAPIPGNGMDTGPVEGSPTTCKVRIDPSFVSGRPADALIKFFYAHEFFHCFQFQWNATFDWRLAKWLIDGSADFAASDLYRGVYSPPGADLSTAWFTTESRPLSARWYDAWGLFETWHQEGRDAYVAIKAMVQGVNSSDVPAALALGGMDGLLYRMAWSTHSARARIFPDPPWQLAWPGPDQQAGPHNNVVQRGTRGIGRYTVKGVGNFAHPQLLVNMTNDVGLLFAVPKGGPLTTYTREGTVSVAEGSTGRFCFDPGGCRCPEGTTAGAIQMDAGAMVFSFPAAAQAASAGVEARKWDPEKFCEKKKPKRGSSNGDPHLVTFDGQPFNVMTLGEFVNARDPQGDFEVQTRHEPAGLPGAAGSSAVAIGTGDHRVTFTAADFSFVAEPIVRVDGAETTEASVELGDATVKADDAVPTWTITWPDTTTVELAWSAGWFVTISAPDERAARLVGLMGSAADGDFRNDLQMPDGTVVDPVEAARTDSEYSLAWLVDDDTTLFDYEPGQSHETFRIKHRESTLIELLDDALETCGEALGEEALSHELESCAYDVSATGEEQYAEAYETVVEDRVAAEAGEVTVTTEPTQTTTDAVESREGTPTLTLSGTLAASYSDDMFDEGVVDRLAGTFEAAEGTVVLARADLCAADVTLFLDVRNVESDAMSPVFVCDPRNLGAAMADDDDEVVRGEAYLWLPRAGTYEVTIESDAEDAGFVQVDVFVDPSPTVVPNDEVAADGDTTTLEGIGDTVVYQSGSENVTYAASGLDTACVLEAYGAPKLGDDSVWPLGTICAHDSEVSTPGLDVPLIVFARTDDPIDVELTPS